LLGLLQVLAGRGYEFVTPTPATHAQVVARRPGQRSGDLREIFGWSLPFERSALDQLILDVLCASDAMEDLGCGASKSRYRVASLGDNLYLHSAYPTNSADAVFFGPDSYRFADFIKSELVANPPGQRQRLVDIGAGAGVGAIVAATLHPSLDIVMSDINPEALRLAAINARAAGIRAECILGGNLDSLDGPIDIALANPPYLIDAAGRDYRDGGDMHGGQVAYDMAVAATERISPGDRLVLYTGSAIIDGADPLREALKDLAGRTGFSMSYREIDPDVLAKN